MLYHYQVYMPESVLSIVPKNRVKLIYSKHAQAAAQNDRYGEFCLPLFLNYADTTIVEICTTEKKIVARFPIDQTRDCVIVTIPAREKSKEVVWNL